MSIGARSRTSAVLAVAFVAALSDCGGGSSDGGSPSVPTGPPGTLDATFGNGGIVLTTPNAPAAANAMVLQPDGMIVVAGSIGEGAAKSFYLARYKPDGTLDPGFGNGGTITTVFNPVAGSEARALAIQPDGKIIAVGGSASACALSRYNADGSLDSSFGTGGLVQIPLPVGDYDCSDVAIRPDGRLVTTRHSIFSGTLIGFNPDGSRDPSFGSDGVAQIPCPSGSTCTASRVVIRTDGNLVVAGTRSYVGLTTQFVQNHSRILLAQMDGSGIPDAGFGLGGYVSLHSVNDDPYCVAGGTAVDPDGRVVVSAGSPSCFYSMARVVADGSLDSGFGVVGYAGYPTAGASFEGSALSLQTNGKLVIAGSTFVTQNLTNVFSVALIRYTSDGRIDPGFGNAGLVVTPIAASAVANAAAILPDGRIVVAGTATSASGQHDIFIARYFGDATLTAAH